MRYMPKSSSHNFILVTSEKLEVQDRRARSGSPLLQQPSEMLSFQTLAESNSNPALPNFPMLVWFRPAESNPLRTRDLFYGRQCGNLCFRH